MIITQDLVSNVPNLPPVDADKIGFFFGAGAYFYHAYCISSINELQDCITI
jgi:hypothetical protein